MGPELIADRRIVRQGTSAGQDLPWQEAMPRIHAYLSACGVSDALRREEIVAAILTRLHSLLPLHQGENPVEIAMRETVQWVEDHRPLRDLQRSANTGPATPPRAELAMPEQCIELRRLRWTRKAKPHAVSRRRVDTDESQAGIAVRDKSTAKGSQRNGAVRGIRARRVLFASLIVATTAGAIALLSGSMQQGGLSPLEFLLVLLYAVLFGWIDRKSVV